MLFPRDEGYHPWASDEWWYFNCHVKSPDGREFGLAVCLFPQYVLDILVDNSARSVLHRWGESGLPFQGSRSMLDVTLGRSRWMQLPGQRGAYSMHYEAGGLVADLAMRSQKPPVLLAGEGKIREGLLGDSFYYAQTSIDVEGELVVGGTKLAVKGRGWIDRQWGTWEWSGLGGWRWFSVQLDNGVEVAGIQITHPVTGAVCVETFNLANGDGTAEVLSGVTVRALRTWKSPETGGEYPVDWVVSAGGRLELRVAAVVDSQEVNPGLWEGSCKVTGSWDGSPVAGRAFVEVSRSRVYGRGSLRAAMLAIGVVDRFFRRLGVRSRLVDRTFSLIAGSRRG